MAVKLIDKFLYKVGLYLLKIIPMLMALCYFLNTTLWYVGVDLDILSYIGSISLLPLIAFYILSYMFKFCEYHRIPLHYIIVVNVLSVIDYYIIDIKEDYLLSMYLIIAAICLFLMLYLKFKVCKHY